MGAAAVCWFLYPILYFTNVLDAKNYAPMSSGTWDDTGAKYNISRVLNSDFTLNQTAMDAYSRPQWSVSYAMYFFWGFAATTGALMYAILWYGKQAWIGLKESWNNKRSSHNDPYLALMDKFPRAPHWWYALLLGLCSALAIAQLYGSDMELPWWWVSSVHRCIPR